MPGWSNFNSSTLSKSWTWHRERERKWCQGKISVVKIIQLWIIILFFSFKFNLINWIPIHINKKITIISVITIESWFTNMNVTNNKVLLKYCFNLNITPHFLTRIILIMSRLCMNNEKYQTRLYFVAYCTFPYVRNTDYLRKVKLISYMMN